MVKIPVHFSFILFILIGLTTTSCIKTKIPDLDVSTDKVGLGLLHFSPGQMIKFYENANTDTPFDSLVTEKIKLGLKKGKADFKTSRLGNKLKPYVLEAGDSDIEGDEHRNMGLIHFSPEITFRVVKKEDNNYTVIINEKSGQTSVVKLDPAHNYRKTARDKGSVFFDPNFVDTQDPDWFLYENWEMILKRAWSVDIPEDYSFYDKPDGYPIKLSEKIYGLGVDSVRGDWARFYYKFSEDSNPKEIWAKWKDHNEIKVNITLHGGYE